MSCTLAPYTLQLQTYTNYEESRHWRRILFSVYAFYAAVGVISAAYLHQTLIAIALAAACLFFITARFGV